MQIHQGILSLNHPPANKYIPMLSSHIKIHQNICLDPFLLINGVPFVYISLLIQKRFIIIFMDK